MKPVKFGNEKALSLDNKIQICDLNNKINSYNVDIEYKRYHFLDKNRCKELKQKEHSFVLNTYGAKYLLFLTYVNFKPYVLYINRKNGTYFLVKSRFSLELYDDTILEGETIKIDNKWYFYISDCLVYKKEITINEPYRFRHSIMKNIVENHYISDNFMEPFQLLVKDKFEYKDMQNIKLDYCEKIPFRTNGFLFKCEDKSSYDILYIFPECRNKKDADSNASDSPKITTPKNTKTEAVYLMKTTEFPDVYELYMFDAKGKEARIGYAGIPNLECSKMVRLWFNGKDSLYAKFNKNAITDKWIPQQIVELSK